MRSQRKPTTAIGFPGTKVIGPRSCGSLLAVEQSKSRACTGTREAGCLRCHWRPVGGRTAMIGRQGRLLCLRGVSWGDAGLALGRGEMWWRRWRWWWWWQRRMVCKRKAGEGKSNGRRGRGTRNWALFFFLGRKEATSCCKRRMKQEKGQAWRVSLMSRRR